MPCWWRRPIWRNGSDADDAVSLQYLDNIRKFADSSVNSIRDIALLLRPSMLDDLGLMPALEWQAREVSRRSGIKVKVIAENVTDSLPDEMRTCIYRLVQEALQNVFRHSGAKSAVVTVRQDGGLRFADRGRRRARVRSAKDAGPGDAGDGRAGPAARRSVRGAVVPGKRHDDARHTADTCSAPIGTLLPFRFSNRAAWRDFRPPQAHPPLTLAGLPTVNNNHRDGYPNPCYRSHGKPH